MIVTQSLKNNDIVLFLPNILRNGEESDMIINHIKIKYEKI